MIRTLGTFSIASVYDDDESVVLEIPSRRNRTPGYVVEDLPIHRLSRERRRLIMLECRRLLLNQNI